MSQAIRSKVKKCMQAWSIAVAISGCMQQPVLHPVTDPTIRYYGNGFTALPPQGKGWHLTRHDPYALAFGKRAPGKEEPHHTFVATVQVMKPPAKKTESAADFPQIIEQLFVQTLTEGRFRLVSVKAASYGAKGDFCAQYDIVQEERDNPNALGILLEITAHGFICLDISTQFMIHAFHSERKAQGSDSAIDDELKRETDGFLSNVEFTPFH